MTVIYSITLKPNTIKSSIKYKKLLMELFENLEMEVDSSNGYMNGFYNSNDIFITLHQKTTYEFKLFTDNKSYYNGELNKLLKKIEDFSKNKNLFFSSYSYKDLSDNSVKKTEDDTLKRYVLGGKLRQKSDTHKHKEVINKGIDTVLDILNGTDFEHDNDAYFKELYSSHLFHFILSNQEDFTEGNSDIYLKEFDYHDYWVYLYNDSTGEYTPQKIKKNFNSHNCGTITI